MAKAKKHPLVGAIINGVRQMADSEMSARGWHTKPAVLILSSAPDKGKNPTTLLIFPSADPEGNDGGTIFGISKHGSFYMFGDQPDDQKLMRGLVILNVRPMSKKELEDQAWDIGSWEKAPTVLVMSEGLSFFASTDPEGNGPGVWVVESGAGEELL